MAPSFSSKAMEQRGTALPLRWGRHAKFQRADFPLPALRLDPKFEIRTRCFVTKLNYDKDLKKVVSVSYTDMRNGEEYEQPAGIVLLTSYVFSNVQHMLLAGIGEPYDHPTGKG